MWTDLGEGTTFLNSTVDVWVGLIPFSLFTFVVLHIIYRILAHYKFKCKNWILSFRWFSILVTSTIIGNLQYLAFRSFQQILYGGPPATYSSVFLYYFNQTACYVTFFFVVVYACGGHVILQYFIGNNLKLAFDFVRFNKQAMWLLSVTQLLKVLNGFAHAWFYNDAPTQICLIFFGQAASLLAAIVLRKAFVRKSSLVLFVVEYVLRVIVHVVLGFRVFWAESSVTLSSLEDERCDKDVMALVFLVMSTAFLQMFVLMVVPDVTNIKNTLEKQINFKDIATTTINSRNK